MYITILDTNDGFVYLTPETSYDHIFIQTEELQDCAFTVFTNVDYAFAGIKNIDEKEPYSMRTDTVIGLRIFKMGYASE